MSPTTEPSAFTTNTEAATVAGHNCREFFELIDLTHGVPPLQSPVPPAEGTAQARQLITSLFPLDSRVCVAVSLQETKTMEVMNFALKLPATPDGAWFKVNRLTSPIPSGARGGWTDADCATELAMIEMDRAPKPEQLLFWRAALTLGFPIISITDSGGKSLHVIVRVNANSIRTYRDRSRGIINLLGVFLPDVTSGNCSRFTRLPGIYRNTGDAKRFQELIYLNPDAPVWEPGCNFSKEVTEFSKTAMQLPEQILKQVIARQTRNRDPLTEEQEVREFRRRFDEVRVKNGVELDAVISDLGWDLGEPTTNNAGEFKQFIKCPWHAEHSGGGAHDGPTDAYIFRRGTAARFPWGFHCSHSSCCNVYKSIDLLELLRGHEESVLDNHLVPYAEVSELFPDDALDDAPDECASVQACGEPSVVATVPEEVPSVDDPQEDENQGDDADPDATEAMKCSNDFDNTNIFVKKFKGRVHYLHDEKTWLIWHAKRWKRDVTEFVNELANGVCISLIRRAGNDSEMKAAKQAGNMKAIESMLKKARVRREIYSESSKFDTDKWLLGCKNGVLNLRTGEFRPARPQDRITRSVSTRFDPSADCPRWEQFMGEIHPNDPEITRFLQRFFGYALTGSVKEQKMLIFLGHGSNGKSTLVNHIQTVMGEYALTCPKSLLLSSKNGESETSPEVTGMKGIRMGTVSETDPGVSLSDSRIKTMVGGEKVTGRDLYKSYETFEPEAKLFLSTNHTPRVKGNDKGIWRRLMLVEFKEDFDDRRDALLDHILETEHAGILNWMLRGCMEWQEKGLCPPPSVIAGTSEYRQGEDHLGTFIEDRVNFTEPGVDTRKSIIYAAYTDWSRINGSHPMQAASFGKAMTERGGISGRSNSLGRFWTNLVLKDEIMSE